MLSKQSKQKDHSDVGGTANEDPIELAMQERIDKGGTHKSIVL